MKHARIFFFFLIHDVRSIYIYIKKYNFNKTSLCLLVDEKYRNKYMSIIMTIIIMQYTVTTAEYNRTLSINLNNIYC